MKKLTLLIALCAISFVSFSQQEESTYFRPLQGDKAISFNLLGLFDSLALNTTADPLTNAQVVDLRYFFKDNIAFRLGFGINRLNTTTTVISDTSNGAPLIESENKDNQTGISFGFGLEKHIKTKSKRTDPFVGAGLFLSMLGKNTITATNKTTQPNQDYTSSLTETINPGGNIFALVVNAGFFWYFAHNLAIGGEVSLGFATGNVGGKVETSSTTTNSSGGVVTTVVSNTQSENKVKISALQTLNTGAIHLMIKF